jgi:hypothetical protein
MVAGCGKCLAGGFEGRSEEFMHDQQKRQQSLSGTLLPVPIANDGNRARILLVSRTS